MVKKTFEQFVEEAKAIYGDKFEYLMEKFVNMETHFEAKCKKHGLLLIHPNRHLHDGQECLSCKNDTKKDKQLQEFIEKANKKHDNKFDYSKAKYVTNNTKLTIIGKSCKHEFEQTPYSHLNSQGCPKCNGTAKGTTNDFIAKAKAKYGDKFDYSEVVFVNRNSDVKIKCPDHGVFTQTPQNHLKSTYGCPKCYKAIEIKPPGQKLTTEEFIVKAKAVHGNKYNYNLVDYKNSNTPVKIRCLVVPEHGIFEIKPHSHITHEVGCPKCSSQKLTTEMFITKAKAVHGDKYDYSLVVYKGTDKKVKIKCPDHDHIFEQTPATHLRGSACPLNAKNKKSNTAEFIEKAKKVHGDVYDYRLVNYINSTTLIEIICRQNIPFHIFEQAPSQHLSGYSCPACSEYGQLTEIEFLDKCFDIHGDRYDYSCLKYSKMTDDVVIICPDHGKFIQRAVNHANGQGCPKCGRMETGNKLRKPIEIFIEQARAIHGDKYDYSDITYINSRSTKINIYCNYHKKYFMQALYSHLAGSGCPKCAFIGCSKKQIAWLEYLMIKHNIYIQHAKNKGEYKVGDFKVDGYCVETKTVYEFHGDLFHGNPEIYKMTDKHPLKDCTFMDLYMKTLRKDQYIRKQGYKLITIWENDWNILILAAKKIQRWWRLMKS
jgi:hypothetical protein